jgi:hypothetical protein
MIVLTATSARCFAGLAGLLIGVVAATVVITRRRRRAAEAAELASRRIREYQYPMQAAAAAGPGCNSGEARSWVPSARSHTPPVVSSIGRVHAVCTPCCYRAAWLPHTCRYQNERIHKRTCGLRTVQRTTPRANNKLTA